VEQIWHSETHGTLQGVPFRFHHGGYEQLRTTEEEIVVLKQKSMFANYQSLARRGSVRRVVEVGVFEGGAALLFADMFPEAKIVGVDWRPGNPAIQRHIETMGYGDRVKLYWGVSQDDAARLGQIMRAEFGEGEIDAVIDDCSHLYGYTTRSFDFFYPRLRRGGVYVLEDWGWAHTPGYTLPPYFQEEPKPLSAMVTELVLASASQPDAFEMALTHNQMVIHKFRELPPFEQLITTHAPFDWVGYARRNP
jgi:cephalosporin hydroxylase